MNHIMFDIEALSRKLGAVVLSIGAVVFDPDSDKIGETFSIRLPAQEQIDKGWTRRNGNRPLVDGAID